MHKAVWLAVAIRHNRVLLEGEHHFIAISFVFIAHLFPDPWFGGRGWRRRSGPP